MPAKASPRVVLTEATVWTAVMVRDLAVHVGGVPILARETGLSESQLFRIISGTTGKPQPRTMRALFKAAVDADWTPRPSPGGRGRRPNIAT